MTDEELAALKLQHGVDVHVLTVHGETIAVRKPKRIEYKRFRLACMGEDLVKREEAAETMLRSCVLSPAPEALNEMFERLPAIVDSFSSALIKLAGASKTEDVETKKA